MNKIHFLYKKIYSLHNLGLAHTVRRTTEFNYLKVTNNSIYLKLSIKTDEN